MSYALDTNVLARSIEEAHPMHGMARHATDSLLAHGETACIFPQNLYESWLIATRPVEQNGLGLTPSETETHLQEFARIFSLMKDVATIYAEWKSLVSQYSVIGKNAHAHASSPP